MYIKQATIYGFGKWVDYSIDFSQDSFTCIYGDNESGKSTLQEFILFMLFGLPPRKRAFHRPKTSGKMGGRLIIVNEENEEYTIERFDEVNNGAAICYLADGNTTSEAWLQKQLHGMTKEVYQSIYSFSALDLNHFTSINDEDLGEILLGIGLTGSKNIYAIEKKLDDEIGKIFKPTGKLPLINKQFQELDDLHMKLVDDRRREATYHEQKEKSYSLRQRIKEFQNKLQKKNEQALQVERHLNYLPLIQTYNQLKQEDEATPFISSFPEDGIERLEQIKDKLLPIQSKLAVLKANADRLEDSLKTLETKTIDPVLAGEVKLRLEEKLIYEANKNKLKKLTEEAVHLDLTMDQKIKDLGLGLTTEIVTQLELPFYLEKMWQDLKSEADVLTITNEQISEEKNTIEKQKESVRTEIQTIQKELLTDQEIVTLEKKIEIYQAEDYVQQAQTEMIKKREKWQEEKQVKEKQYRIYLIGAALLTLVLSVLAVSFEIPSLYQLAILSIVLGLAQFGFGKKSIQDTERLVMDKQSEQVKQNTITLEEKQEAEKLLHQQAENDSQLASLHDEEKRIQVNIMKWEEKNKTYEKQEQKLIEEIALQEQNYPFLQEIELAYWPEFYQALIKLLEIKQAKEENEQKYIEVEEEQKKYRSLMKQTLSKINERYIDDSIIFQYETLKKVMKNQNDQKQNLQHQNNELKENQDQQEQLQEQMKIYIKEIEKLLTIADLETEEEFYQKAKRFSKQQDRRKKMAETKKQLEIVFSSRLWKEVYQGKQDELELTVQKRNINKEIEQLNKVLEQKRQQLADVHAQLKTMEKSESYPELMHRYTMEQEQAKKLAYEWAVLTTAKEMLAKAKRQFREKHLSQVIEKATRYFKLITDDRYVKVIAPLDDQPFQVETIEKQRYKVNELSQGSIDQLYVSLRFAISETLSEEHAIPFMIDDAFVHFDSLRMKRMIQIVEQISKQKQVILFTCRQDIVQELSVTNILHLNGPSVS